MARIEPLTLEVLPLACRDTLEAGVASDMFTLGHEALVRGRCRG